MSRRILNLIGMCILSATILSTGAFGQGPAASSDDEPTPVPVKKLDVNSASREQLMKLPGITEALSQKIIAGRPYVSKSDLIERKIVPNATYAGITNLIEARQPNSAPAKGR